MLRLYNTESKEKEVFKPFKEEVSIYSCGPTVYGYQHIGNMRAALFVDLLKRVLKYFGYKLNDVINITDVGHLVSDADAGEDKMVKAMKRENKDPYEIARFYEEAYLNDLKKLRVTLPKHMPRATEHIKEQLDIIDKLEQNGYTYQTSDGVYFDVSKLEDYGKLSGQKLEDKKEGARVDNDSEKRNPQDFALWKFLTGDNKNHIMKWESKYSKEGFPGWHLECSAMSHKYLGSEIDIHTGGIEHIPIHHENEIAQNKGSGIIRSINFWMHNAHLQVDNKKMAKSEGTAYLLSDLEEKGFSPLEFRELNFRTHYRKRLNFTFESLNAARANIKKINEFNSKLNSLKENSEDDHLQKYYEQHIKDFDTALEDDLNMPQALSSVYEFMSEVNKLGEYSKKDIEVAKKFLSEVNSVLDLLEENEEIPKEVIELAEKREEARAEKNFEESDRLRDEIKEKGYEIKDSKEGFQLKKL